MLINFHVVHICNDYNLVSGANIGRRIFSSKFLSVFFAKKIFLPAFCVSAGWVRSCGEYHINMRAVRARTYAYACVDSPHSLFCREGCSQELLLQVGVGQKQPVDARGFP